MVCVGCVWGDGPALIARLIRCCWRAVDDEAHLLERLHAQLLTTRAVAHPRVDLVKVHRACVPRT